MKSNSSAKAGRLVTPWTLRVFDALPASPLVTGIAFTIGLLAIFFAGRHLLDGAGSSTANDLRVAITQILITTYSGSAYAYLLMSARRSTLELAPVAGQLREWQSVVDRAGKHRQWLLPLIGLGSYLVLGVTVTNLTTPDPVNPWNWRGWNYDIYWHRATTLVFVYWLACLCYVSVVESSRLSRLSDKIDTLDILELTPYQPLIQQGMTNALLVIGMASIMSLLAVEDRYWSVIFVFWVAFIALAGTGVILPLRGIRKKIRVAKAGELDWCRQALRTARDEQKSGGGGQHSISEILAYRTVIESIRNWPFDSHTLVRFSLYILIPLGSWLGGALVERLVDLFLS